MNESAIRDLSDSELAALQLLAGNARSVAGVWAHTGLEAFWGGLLVMIAAERGRRERERKGMTAGAWMRRG